MIIIVCLCFYTDCGACDSCNADQQCIKHKGQEKCVAKSCDEVIAYCQFGFHGLDWECIDGQCVYEEYEY